MIYVKVKLHLITFSSAINILHGRIIIYESLWWFDDDRTVIITTGGDSRNFYIGPFYFQRLNLLDEQMDPWDRQRESAEKILFADVNKIFLNVKGAFFEQACKPQSYASPKLRLINWPIGVETRM